MQNLKRKGLAFQEMLDVMRRILSFRDYKIRAKLVLVILVFFILSASISIFSLISNKNIKNAHENKSLIKEIDKHALNILHNEKEYLDTLSDYYLSQYTMNINNLTVTFKKLKKFYPQETDIEFIMQVIKDHMQGFFAISDNIKDSVNRGYEQKTLSKIISDAKSDLSKQHSEFYSTLMKFNTKVNNQIDNYVRATENKTKLSFLFVGTAIIIVTFLVLRGVNILIISPLTELSENMRRFGAGEREVRTRISSKDEIGDLSNSFNEMAEDLQKTTVSRDSLAQEVVEHKRTQEKLKEAMNIKSKFTSMVSHELRTPLTAIKEGIGIVLDGSTGPLNDDQKDFLDTAKRNVDRLHRLINEVLDFAKMESGKMEYKMLENDLNAAIKEIVEVQKTVAQGKGLYLRTELDSNLGKIKFDHDKVIQVLTNLTNNALKFTEQGGITITSAKDGQFIKVAVKDTGEGIKEEDLPKIFQEFQQVGTDKYRKPGSTGLGLAISKEIIEAHNGKIWIESKRGTGTEFIFILPIEGGSQNVGEETNTYS